jgi:hypothetical protein
MPAELAGECSPVSSSKTAPEASSDVLISEEDCEGSGAPFCTKFSPVAAEF